MMMLSDLPEIRDILMSISKLPNLDRTTFWHAYLCCGSLIYWLPWSKSPKMKTVLRVRPGGGKLNVGKYFHSIQLHYNHRKKNAFIQAKRSSFHMSRRRNLGFRGHDMVRQDLRQNIPNWKQYRVIKQLVMGQGGEGKYSNVPVRSVNLGFRLR